MTTAKHKITFGKLVIRNFLSIEYLVVDLGSHSGLNYVFGSNLDVAGTRNGSGKSAIFCDSILFAMFGKTLRNIGNKYVAHRQVDPKSNVEVQLELKIGGDVYLATSGLSMPGKASYFNLHKNGEDISKSSIKETRRFFEAEILEATYDMFKNRIILSSQESGKFLSLPKGGKREFVEGIFRLDVFGRMLKQIRDDANAISKEILVLQSNISQISENIVEYTDKDNKFAWEKESRIKTFRNKILAKEAEIITLKVSIETLEKKKTPVDSARRTVMDEGIKKIERTAADVRSAIKVSETNIANSESLVKKYTTALENVCPDCNARLKDVLSIRIAEERIAKEKDNVIKRKESLVKLTEAGKKMTLERTQIDAAIKTNGDIDAKIVHAHGAVDHLVRDVATLKGRISEEEVAVSPFTTMLTECVAKKETFRKRMDSYNKDRKAHDILQHVVSEDGVKKFIIKDLVDMLNVRIRKYLDEMGARFTCVFDTAFNCEFLTESGPTSYENFSCGEKVRIDIAILFSFKDILSTLGTLDSSIIVLDEFIDLGLDDYSINAIIKMLKQLHASTGQTIFLISHRMDIDVAEFDNVIEVQKNNGFSTIVADNQGFADK